MNLIKSELILDCAVSLLAPFVDRYLERWVNSDTPDEVMIYEWRPS